MPINYKVRDVYVISNIGTLPPAQNNIGTGTEGDDDDWLNAPSGKPSEGRDWLDLLNDANSYLSLHLLFTYVFTILALRFIYKNYARFIRARQLYSLELVHSIAARTVLVTDLPNHLRGERALAVYFENMGLTVESVSICREVEYAQDIDRPPDGRLASLGENVGPISRESKYRRSSRSIECSPFDRHRR